MLTTHGLGATDQRNSPESAKAVLTRAAAIASGHGIAEEDIVQHPLLPQVRPWPVGA